MNGLHHSKHESIHVQNKFVTRKLLRDTFSLHKKSPTQTKTTMLTEPTHQTIQTLVAAKKHLPGALLPILHDIQDALGYIPAQALGDIAQALNLSRAEVHGVVSFYHFFRHEPAAAQVVQICRAEACQSMGSEALWAHACSRQQAQGFTLEPVYCLGLCSSSPAMVVNEKLHARMDADKFDRLVADARSAA
ncbi:MAG: formate dehydrogenase gamma subunit [Comamonadaceae bacterium]|nr:MAG: formate dehydrogenase gamma subunit [Comamonadaceae bacterium]